MGSLASAKIVALPMADKHPDPEPAPVVRSSTTEAPASTAASKPPAQEPEAIATVSLTSVFRSLLAKITRERIITAALACV